MIGARAKRAHTGDRDVDRAVNAIAEDVDAIRRGDPSLDGVLLEAVTISNTAVTTLAHKLGRPYVGWRVERHHVNAALTAAGTILESSTARRETHLELRAVGYNVPVVVTLRVW